MISPRHFYKRDGDSGGKTAAGRSGPGKMMSALVRTPEGNLRVMRYDDYKTRSEFEKDLRGNGFRVLNLWDGNITDDEADRWELLHRK